MEPIEMTRTVGYLNRLTKDRRYITDVALADGSVPVHLEGTRSVVFGSAVVRLEGKTLVADLSLTSLPPTGVPMIELDVGKGDVRPHFVGGRIVRVNVQGTVAGVSWTRAPAWNILRGRSDQR